MSKPIPAEAHDILRDLPTGHLATVRPDGRLSVNPVALLFEDGLVRFSTTKDRAKYHNLLADPRVAICVPHRNNPNRYIELRGHVEIADDTDRAFIDRVARHYMDEDRYPFDHPKAERVTVTIVAEQVSMRAIPLSDNPPGAPDSSRA
jgi:PPOX class probable F420-dependent enzyme